MALSTTVYYTRMSKYIVEMCERPENPENVLDLFFKLKDFHSFLESKGNR